MNGRRRTFARAVVATLACAGAAALGCKTPDPTPPPQDIPATWRNPLPTRAPVRRIIVPPFEDRSGYPAETEQFRLAMVDALSRRGDRECIAVSPSDFRDELPASIFIDGTVPRKALVSAARRFRADGVLFGIVHRLRPYEPMLLAFTTELIASDDGSTVWSVDAVFDASSRAVELDVRNYHDTRLADARSLEGWRLILLSPSRYFAYAAMRTAEKAP
jgi:hypothetical protein